MSSADIKDCASDRQVYICFPLGWARSPLFANRIQLPRAPTRSGAAEGYNMESPDPASACFQQARLCLIRVYIPDTPTTSPRLDPRLLTSTPCRASPSTRKSNKPPPSTLPLPRRGHLRRLCGTTPSMARQVGMPGRLMGVPTRLYRRRGPTPFQRLWSMKRRMLKLEWARTRGKSRM